MRNILIQIFIFFVCNSCTAEIIISYSSSCVDDEIEFVASNYTSTGQFTWLINNQEVFESSSPSFTYSFENEGDYIITVHYSTSSVSYIGVRNLRIKDCKCLGNIALPRNKEYYLSGWVKKEVFDDSSANYQGTSIKIVNSNGTSWFSMEEFSPSGNIIDGWQKIEGVFVIPMSVSIEDDLIVILRNSNLYGNVYFDDIRIQPFDAAMKTFVYDPKSLKLVAELDQNNFATFYDYDNQGDLIRVKKETERGVKTLRESRQNLIIPN